MGMGFVAVAHMRNISMNPLNVPLIEILRIGCDVKLDMMKIHFIWS